MNTNSDKKHSISVISSFDWSVPGTPELICEAAEYAGIQSNYFSKPTSIFKKKENQPSHYKKKLRANNHLLFCGPRLARSKTLSRIQNSFILRQIRNSYRNEEIRNSTLIYTNLESIIGTLPELKKMYRRVFYLCADYSDLGEDFRNNASMADKILVIPDSMVEKISDIYGDKTVKFPQLTSPFEKKAKLTSRVMQLLKAVPTPRIVYSGEINSRVNMNIYSHVAKRLSNCSFLSFHDGRFEQDKNCFKLPWLEKFEIFQLLENSSLGFMPYDIDDPHNYHCVPLKLFEYFQIGMPVVCSDLVNLNIFNSVIYKAIEAQQFVDQIKVALNENPDSQLRKERFSIGKNHSTANQVEIIKELIR